MLSVWANIKSSAVHMPTKCSASQMAAQFVACHHHDTTSLLTGCDA